MIYFIRIAAILAAACGGCAKPHSELDQGWMKVYVNDLENSVTRAEKQFRDAESGQAQAARELAGLKARLRRLAERLDRLAPEAPR